MLPLNIFIDSFGMLLQVWDRVMVPCKSGKKFCGFDESGNPNPPGKGCVQSCQWFPPPPESSTDDQKESFKNRHRSNKKYQVFFIYLFHVLLIYMLLRLFYKKIAK